MYLLLMSKNEYNLMYDVDILVIYVNTYNLQLY